jgi:large repetitive protein
MAVRNPVETSASRRAGFRICAVTLAVAVAVLALRASSAQATFHEIKVREVHPSTSDDSYVVLQMYVSSQNFLSGHSMKLYDSSGSLAHTSTFAASVSNGKSQATVLVGDTGVGSVFGVTPDLEDSGLSIPAAGGAVCWNAAGVPADCVSWGNFNGGPAFSTATNTTVGNSASPTGITAGKAIRRSIAPGCSTLLEDGDDTNDSAADFAEVTPAPRNNASTITEHNCTAPNTSITNATPAGGERTKSEEATFTFTASPSEEASFECKLDLEPSFTACASPKTYTGLAGGTGTLHKFEVRAKHPVNGTDPTPAKREWTVDTVGPSVIIDTHPADPSSGTNPAFGFHSESGANSFECSLVKFGEPDSFASCSSPETFPSVGENGKYTFKVQAKDTAANQGSPTAFSWDVDTSLLDETPPEAKITSHPTDPSESSIASFAYESNEPGSAFECSLDGAPFTSCPATGIAYADLAPGPHSFQVRAIDTSSNIGSPVGFSFTIVSPPQPVRQQSPLVLGQVPNTVVTGRPPARTRDRTPTLRFKSTLLPATFECKVDGKPFKPCRSPLTTKPLAFGRHTIKVRALAAVGPDPTPAVVSFKVMRGPR